MSCVVTEETLTIPALSHVVCIGGPDHEDRNVSQSHQQVLTSTRLPISASPCRLSARGMEGEKKLLLILCGDSALAERHSPNEQ